MRREELFTEGAKMFRVNSRPFKVRRNELHISLDACAAALTSHCTVPVSRMKLWRCEKQAFFMVDAEMYAAIKKVLRV